MFDNLNIGSGCLGGLKFGFGKDVPQQNLKEDPYKYHFFKKKWPTHIPICSILGQILSKITQFFLNFLKFELILAQIWENCEKSSHSYTKFAFCKGSFIPRA